MKIEMTLPMAFEGVPNGARGARIALTEKAVAFDVPEVSEAETETVLECRSGWSRRVDYRGTPETERSVLARDFLLVSHAGRLYRNASEPRSISLFWSSARGGVPTWLPGARLPVRQEGRPTAALAREAVVRALEDESWQYRTDPRRSRMPKWPPDGFAIPHDRAMGAMKSVDPESLAVAEAMVERQVGRLLLVEGELWVETELPTIEVHVKTGGSNSGIWMFDAVGPSERVGDMMVRNFPLSARDDALAFVERYSDTVRGPNCQGIFTDTAEMEMADPAMFDFDHDAHDRWRIGMEATRGLREALRRAKGRGDGIFGEDERALMARADAQADASNPVLGRFGDFDPFFDDLVVAWRRHYHSNMLNGFDNHSPVVSRMRLHDVGQRLAERPISIWGVDTPVRAP